MAFAPSDAIRGGFVESTTRENFRIAHDISSYSLTAVVKAAEPMLEGRAGSILTLTYLGAVRSLPSYNVMGLAKASLEAGVRFLAADLGPKNIRVNGISAGPIKTLAAAGIGGFRKMLSHVASIAPLRRNVTTEDVGDTAAFLASDLPAGITGEIICVDGGFNTVGMSFPKAINAPNNEKRRGSCETAAFFIVLKSPADGRVLMQRVFPAGEDRKNQRGCVIRRPCRCERCRRCAELLRRTPSNSSLPARTSA